jgi:hypothetical protein
MSTNGYSRRELLRRSWNGIGSLALGSLLAEESARASRPLPNPLAAKPPHLVPKAKRCIFIFASGGVSQVDTFDYKPALAKLAGKRMPQLPNVEGEIEAFLRNGATALPSPFEFRQRGESGRWISNLFENLSTHADKLAFVYGVKGESNNHSPATMQINTGSPFQGNPSVGAWVTYGLGSTNQNLPGYVVLHDARGGPVNGPAVWQSGYLPATFQGTPFRPTAPAILNLDLPAGMDRARARQELDFIRWMNERHAQARAEPGALEARIAAYELAFRMQMAAAQVTDLANEPASMRRLYGMDDPITEAFARQCMMARRLVEEDVRFVLVVHGWENGQFSWDHHKEIESLMPARASEVDKPIAGLLTDLEQRGLLEDTLVVWTSEMGRTPFIQGAAKYPGRNHNQWAMVSWFAGAGVKPGATAGQTDEFGLRSAGETLLIRDLHATVLHSIGLDQSVLTFLHEGRFKRLTDTGGRVLKEIFA